MLNWMNDYAITAWRRSEVNAMFKRKLVPEKAKQQFSYFPLWFLKQSLDSYVTGSYIAAIVHGAQAAEFALYIRMWEHDNNIQIGAEDFGGLIGKAKNTVVIGNGNIELLDNMRQLRNCYTHFYNIIKYRYNDTQEKFETAQRHEDLLKLINPNYKKLSRYIEDDTLNPALHKKKLDELQQIAPNLPKQKTGNLEFMKKRASALFIHHISLTLDEQYYTWTVPLNIITLIGRNHNRKTNKKNYPQERFDAIAQIDWCNLALTNLKFFEYQDFRDGYYPGIFEMS